MREPYDYNSLIDFKYRRPEKNPVRLEYDKATDTLTITAHVTFSGSMMKPYANRPFLKSGSPVIPPADTVETFADAACEGIADRWGGTYNMSELGGPESLRVIVNILRKDKGEVPDRQRCFRIQRTYGNGTSFVTSPVWRWVWGVFRGNRECFATLNWSPRFPGTININKYRTKYSFQSTMAHEFGHILGLGDAYDAFYRFFYSAPGTDSYMMRFNRKVAPEEILMCMKAHRTGRMQYFPCVFDLETVLTRIKRKVFKHR